MYAFKATLFLGMIASGFWGLTVDASAAASAAGLSYDYVRVSYDRTRFADENGPHGRFPTAGDGLELAASVEVGRGVHIWGRVASDDEESYLRPPAICVVPCSSRVDSDATVISGGAGYAVNLAPEVGMFIRAGAVAWKVDGKETPDTPGFSIQRFDESYYGWRIGVGARAVVAPRVELFGGIDQWEVENRPSTPALQFGYGSMGYLVDSQTTFTGGFEYRPIDRIGLRLSAELNTDEDLDASIGIVWRF